jgi:drug/metabolite transporter (DMT)-like permease
MTSIGYVLSAVLGKVFFGELVTWQRWLGTSFIVVGIIFVGLTAANTTRPEPAR